MEKIKRQSLDQIYRENCNNLVRQYWQTLWSCCYKLTLNKQEAEILLEEVLYRIVKYFDKYDQNKPFMKWVWTIAINALKTYKKNKLKDFAYIEESKEGSVSSSQNTGFNTITIQYLGEKISKCLERLKPIERIVFCMKYFDEKKYSEIAETIHINENSARVYFLRAKEKVKKALGGWIYEL